MIIPQVTFNLILFSLLVGLSLLGFLLGENRLKTISYGAFIAYFIILVSSETLINTVSSKVNLKIEITKFIFVGLVCSLFFLGALLSQKKASNKVRSIALGILTALFIVAFGINVLPSAMQDGLVTDFNLAAQIYNFRLVFMAALTVWLITIQLIPKKHIDDDKKK